MLINIHDYLYGYLGSPHNNKQSCTIILRTRKKCQPLWLASADHLTSDWLLHQMLHADWLIQILYDQSQRSQSRSWHFFLHEVYSPITITAPYITLACSGFGFFFYTYLLICYQFLCFTELELTFMMISDLSEINDF